jgi:hypothetical protein
MLAGRADRHPWPQLPRCPAQPGHRKSSTATQVIAVIIDFLLIIIAFAFLELRPEATKALLKHSQDWLLGHALQLMTAIALLLGAYLAVSGLVRLSLLPAQPPQPLRPARVCRISRASGRIVLDAGAPLDALLICKLRAGHRYRDADGCWYPPAPA